jgi:hypothetical protein
MYLPAIIENESRIRLDRATKIVVAMGPEIS